MLEGSLSVACLCQSNQEMNVKLGQSEEWIPHEEQRSHECLREEQAWRLPVGGQECEVRH